MEAYDLMDSGRYVPYAMLCGPKKYASAEINTDDMGFRFTYHKKDYVIPENIQDYSEINILIGASTVFGVGATSDRTTISSIISEKTGELWLNLGNRGCNSLQEYIHLILFLQRVKRVKRIVFLSGINDLYLSVVNNTDCFYDQRFWMNDNLIELSITKRVFAGFFSWLYRMPFEHISNVRISRMPFAFINDWKTASYKIHEQTIEEKFEIYFSRYQRNFKLYKGISVAYNCEIEFFLQPFAHWIDRNHTENEAKIFDYLNELQKNETWFHVSKVLKDREIYKMLLSTFHKIASEEQLKFTNCNEFLKEPVDYFVDAVHLTDEANRIIADKIIKS
ncbi:hypothetical protein [Daejeonella sp.]|nr:hypothetical protein [Daejeonella sp.]